MNLGNTMHKFTAGQLHYHSLGAQVDPQMVL